MESCLSNSHRVVLVLLVFDAFGYVVDCIVDSIGVDDHSTNHS